MMGYPLPQTIEGNALECVSIQVPDERWHKAAFWGAITRLCYAYNWSADEPDTPEAERAAAVWRELLLNPANINTCASSSEIPTPFWDTADDLDDENTPALEGWYGYVDDPEGDPATIGFFENAAIWVMTGLLAISGNVGAAILFHTIAPRFHIAIRTGDVGEIIRILFDGEEKARINTADYDSGEVVRVPIIGDASLSSHDLLIIKAE